jgi:hypothetical protein
MAIIVVTYLTFGKFQTLFQGDCSILHFQKCPFTLFTVSFKEVFNFDGIHFISFHF